MDTANFYAQRAKTKARGILRQILFSMLIAAAALCPYVTLPNSGNPDWSAIVILAIPAGLVLWIVYRVLRFAVGPSLHLFRR